MATIGIEASSILKSRTGIGHYNYQVLSHLPALDRTSQFRVFTNSMKDRLSDSPFSHASNFHHIHNAIPGKVMLELWRWFEYPTVERLIGPVDLFHATNNNPVPQRHGIRVVTIYDLYFIRHPERTDRYGGQYFASVIPRRIGSWHHIVTISEAMKQELKTLLDVPEEKISIASCGLDDFFRIPCGDGDLDQVQLPENYLLSVGTLEPRKNYPRLLEAFSHFRKMSGNENFYCVIAGIDGCGSEAVHEAIDRFGLSDRVLLLGYLTPHQLKCCYRRAAAFVMVSEYEGFGIPVLEAMASETPVIASNTTSFPEVVGDAGILLDPYDVETIAGGMNRVVHDEEFAIELAGKGLKRIDLFTWRQTAEKLNALYHRLLQDRHV